MSAYPALKKRFLGRGHQCDPNDNNLTKAVLVLLEKRGLTLYVNASVLGIIEIILCIRRCFNSGWVD